MKYQTSAAEHEGQGIYIVSFQGPRDVCVRVLSARAFVCSYALLPFKFANGFVMILFFI